MTGATTASATTPAAGTAQASLRSKRDWTASSVARSKERSGETSDEIGFMAARMWIGWPLDMLPSMPPARLVSRLSPFSPPAKSSSCTCEPGLRAFSKAGPISTPLIAWIDMMAAASAESSLRSCWT